MNKKSVFFFLSIIILLQSMQLIFWVNKSNPKPAWDESWHAMISLNIYNQISGQTSPSTLELEQRYPIFAYANNRYPHFFHLLASPFYFFFGTGYKVSILSNIVFIIILVISTFLIGKKLYNEITGLLLSFLISTVPLYTELMGKYLIDFSLSAMVSLGLCLLLYSENFKKLNYSISFGVVFGLGMLTKWSYFIYLLIPISVSFSLFKYKKFFSNIVSALISALLIMSLWYTPDKVSTLINDFVKTSENGVREGDPAFMTLSGIFYYLTPLIEGYSIFYFLLFILSVLHYLLSQNKNPKKGNNYGQVLFINILFIYVLFTLMPNKDLRYIAPVYIFMSLFSASVFNILKSKNIKIMICCLIIMFGIVQYVFSFSAIFQTESADIPDFNSMLLPLNNFPNSTVCIIAESRELNDVNLPYYSMHGNYPVRHMVGNGCNPVNFDFVVLGPIEETLRLPLFEKSKSTLDSRINSFDKIYSSEKIFVFKRKYR